MRYICVYCGSNPGKREEYRKAAITLGQELVKRKIGLVYGGGSIGLMGTIADSVLESGGEVIGVIPRALFRREVAHPHLTSLHEVGSMHERKALMADLSDGFIAMPGGFGTFDELFEITTWAQLGLHAKPIGLLNVADYFTPLLSMVAHASNEGFISASHAALLLCKDQPVELLEVMQRYTPGDSRPKWTELPPLER
jgi:uncharacterized protein (TIGR00730 family)